MKGNLWVNNNNMSTSTTTGSVVIIGGLGIGQNLIIGNASSATDINSGSLVTSGGVGIAENVIIGNASSATDTNSGAYDGVEIVQWYVRDLVGRVTRPVKELKGFKRIHLAMGESQTVSFSIDAKTLSYYDNDGNSVLEPGNFDIMIGTDSQRVGMVSLKVI